MPDLSFLFRHAAVLALLVALAPQTGFSQKTTIDKVVASVGSELVLLSEIEEQKALLDAQQGGLPPDASCMILDNILAQKLLVNQANLDSISVLDVEVETQLDARIEQILAYMNNDYQQFEDYYGQSVNQVKDQFREDLRSQLLADRMRAQVISDITVTPAEVKAFFSRIPVDSLPYFNSEVEVAEIVLRPVVNETEREKAMKKLSELRDRVLVNGEDFAEVATKFSDDFASARIGGDLGWTKRGKFVPEFEAAAYNLEVDEISPIIETEFGFHIIQLLGRRGNTIHTRHILVRPEITEADLQLAMEKLDSVRTLIVSDSLSFSKAVKDFGYKDVQSYNNDGRMINPRTGNNFFEIADLDPDVYFALDTMKVGGICAPFSYRAPNGEVLYRVVKLMSQTNPHRANLKEDYAKIQIAAIEEKKSIYLSDWIQEKVRSTYISIDPMFADGPGMDKWKQQ
ncbi:MAG: peptidylprolyl isomerase [Saprospirales bacterium]|nr:peptidylprolyl isomerase [Saprospirales bacterium]